LANLPSFKSLSSGQGDVILSKENISTENENRQISCDLLLQCMERIKSKVLAYASAPNSILSKHLFSAMKGYQNTAFLVVTSARE